LLRGRLGIWPERIRGRKDLRKIIERARAIERPQEREVRPAVTDTVGYKAIQN